MDVPCHRVILIGGRCAEFVDWLVRPAATKSSALIPPCSEFVKFRNIERPWSNSVLNRLFIRRVLVGRRHCNERSLKPVCSLREPHKIAAMGVGRHRPCNAIATMNEPKIFPGKLVQHTFCKSPVGARPSRA
jgi:hypothetical protein